MGKGRDGEKKVKALNRLKDRGGTSHRNLEKGGRRGPFPNIPLSQGKEQLSGRKTKERKKGGVNQKL